MGEGLRRARKAARATREKKPAKPKWSKEPPTKGGTYWNWNGDPDDAPVPMFVHGGGMGGKTFVTMGQLGLDRAHDCDKWGGWWMEILDPPLPPRELWDV